VLDFSISKMTDVAGTGPGMAMTKTSAMMGTPLYMSPEQMRSSKDVGAQTDIWALGAILFELMAGRPAFLAETVMELAIKVNSEPTPAIRSFRPDVPMGLEAIIFKCLEKDQRQRYRNVAELALALMPFAPKRAKGSVERISGIIQAAGLSASALAVPASPQVDPRKPLPARCRPRGGPRSGREPAGQRSWERRRQQRSCCSPSWGPSSRCGKVLRTRTTPRRERLSPPARLRLSKRRLNLRPSTLRRPSTLSRWTCSPRRPPRSRLQSSCQDPQ
jgi:serine/threonine protein kinase